PAVDAAAQVLGKLPVDILVDGAGGPVAVDEDLCHKEPPCIPGGAPDFVPIIRVARPENKRAPRFLEQKYPEIINIPAPGGGNAAANRVQYKTKFPGRRCAGRNLCRKGVHPCSNICENSSGRPIWTCRNTASSPSPGAMSRASTGNGAWWSSSLPASPMRTSPRGISSWWTWRPAAPSRGR